MILYLTNAFGNSLGWPRVADPVIEAELLGHHSLQQTLRYAHLYDATKRQHYEQAMMAITKRYAIGGH